MPRLLKVPLAKGKKAGAAAKRSKLYAMPEKINPGTVLVDMSKVQWCVGPSIGTGGFGEIYSACRVGDKNYDHVVKCEPHGNGPLFVEMHFYMRNAKLEDIQRYQREHKLKSFGMPHMVGNGSTDINNIKHRFIVMPRYGSDVARHFLANDKRLPEGTVYRLALQIMDVFEYIHSCGYVHADLKGANLLLGLGKTGASQVYLVDYGLASHFTTKDFKPDPKKMHNGTVEYTSRDAHQGVATMRADFEILGYNIIEWLGVELPWVRSKLLEQPVKVQQLKEQFMGNIDSSLKSLFSKGVPFAVAEFIKYVGQLRYNDKPDYEKCRKIFSNALKTLKISNSGPLEFTIKLSNNNNDSPPTTSKKAKERQNAKARTVAKNSSTDLICASDDDDYDVIFEPKQPTKVAPSKGTLKTIAKKYIKPATSPRRHALRVSPKKSPIIALAPISPKRISPRNKQTSPIAKTLSNGTAFSNQTPQVSTSRTTRTTPVTTRANINFSPSISMQMSRPGKTVINDSITPNSRANTVYEFNFELDVSVDANVVINVKRKKKALSNTNSKTSSSSSATPKNSNQRDTEDTPATRVKVRKLNNDEDVSSPKTPVVTVKKSKHVPPC